MQLLVVTKIKEESSYKPEGSYYYTLYETLRLFTTKGLVSS
jgi:hypothetical protein